MNESIIAQSAGADGWKDFSGRTRTTEYVSDTMNISDSAMLREIKVADEQFSIDELTGIINSCVGKYSKSLLISQALTKWLREDHVIYEGKSATEVDRFRGFLLASMGNFPPTEELYGYVKAELTFGGHVYNIAAAAVTARNFKEQSEELIKLMIPYVSTLYLDEIVDLSAPFAAFPYAHPTKARYEIIQTLKSFGESAYPAVKLLDELSSPENFAMYAKDSVLMVKAAEAASYIREITPPCCRKDFSVGNSSNSVKWIEKKNRKTIATDNLILQDQETNQIHFTNLTGKPFVLAFFYTQCSNPLKCASTVNRLADLQVELQNANEGNKIGIYGMTYDPEFDNPSILKKYGEMYGISFAKNVKFLRAMEKSDQSFDAQLKLRVNYGAGTVNQHGIQLFLFDKKGKLAGTIDNEAWAVDDVKNSLMRLARE